jgi:RNA polymerase sigma-70 factor (ECF subfamily)
VRAAVGGDREAVEAVLASIRPLVVRYCRARIGRGERSFDSADDIAQEVCLAVLKALPGYRAQGRPFLAFVYGIAAHKVADARRSSARDKSEPVGEVPEAADVSAGPEGSLLAEEFSNRMARLLTLLPDKQREIVVLRVVVGLSADTAQIVGMTPGAVRVAQHRALTRPREELEVEEVASRESMSSGPTVGRSGRHRAPANLWPVSAEENLAPARKACGRADQVGRAEAPGDTASLSRVCAATNSSAL